MAKRPSSFGEQLRTRRQQLGLSQLQLALDAGISARHLCFIETGRAQASREMVLHLAGHLKLQLREQNLWLLGAGFAPAFEQRGLDAPDLSFVREAAARILANHDPFPAVVLDGGRNIVMGNQGAQRLNASVAPWLLEAPVNIYRLLLHRDGLSRRIVDFEEYSRCLLARLERDVEVTGDPELQKLLTELNAYPGIGRGAGPPSHAKVALSLRITDRGRELAFLTTIATFGTPVDVTVSELVIESLFPADASTAKAWRTR
jgi:transcriptional regulator with XRE-family HTH domain